MSGSAAGNPAQIFEDDPHEDAVVLLYLAVVIVAALGHGLDEEALVLIGEADRGQQGAVLLNVAPMAEADRPVLIEARGDAEGRSEEHTSELQSLMRISYAVFRLKK